MSVGVEGVGVGAGVEEDAHEVKALEVAGPVQRRQARGVVDRVHVGPELEQEANHVVLQSIILIV